MKTKIQLLLVLLLSSSLLRAQSPTLKHSYTFDDGTARDVVGNAHGVIQGFAQAQEGQLLLSEPGQCVVLPTDIIKINRYKAITLEAFIIAEPGNASNTMLSYFGDISGSNGVNYIFQSVENSGYAKSSISCLNTQQPWNSETWTTSDPLNDGMRHHIVSTFDNKTLRLYIDGQLVSDQLIDQRPDNLIENLGTQTAYLGKSGYSRDATWIGAIDAFNIYEDVLSKETIAKAAKAYLPETNIIELPVSFITQSAPFSRGAGSISLEDNTSPDSPWKKTKVETLGIPEDWKDPVVQQIWFDAYQIAYQHYHQGNLNEDFFNQLKVSWNFNPEKEGLSKVPIKCFSHIVLTKQEDGTILYKVDTDNDLDFSDEKIFEPIQFLLSKSANDSLEQYAHWLKAEVLSEGEIIPVELPYLVALTPSRDYLLESFPQIAKTAFKNKTLLVAPAFSRPNFRNESNLMLLDSMTQEATDIIELNHYFSIAGETYQNLGVDRGRKILMLKQLIDTEVRYAAQVGFNAPIFRGQDYHSGNTINLNDYRGKFLFLEFWGTWCGPCVGEVPKLKEIYNEINHEKIEFLGIAEDHPNNLRKFLEKQPLDWPQIISSPRMRLESLYSVQAWPTSFLINPEGKIVEKNLRSHELMKVLDKYLNQNPE